MSTRNLRRSMLAAALGALLPLAHAQQWETPRGIESVRPAPASRGAARSAPAGDKLDLNTATLQELLRLPGMGPEYARRVIAHRPYSARNQLSTRGILPDGEYAKIQDLVVAHRMPKT